MHGLISTVRHRAPFKTASSIHLTNLISCKLNKQTVTLHKQWPKFVPCKWPLNLHQLCYFHSSFFTLHLNFKTFLLTNPLSFLPHVPQGSHFLLHVLPMRQPKNNSGPSHASLCNCNSHSNLFILRSHAEELLAKRFRPKRLAVILLVQLSSSPFGPHPASQSPWLHLTLCIASVAAVTPPVPYSAFGIRVRSPAQVVLSHFSPCNPRV